MVKIIQKSILVFISLFVANGASGQVFNGLGFQLGLNYGQSVVKETFTSNGVNWKYATDEADVAVSWGFFGRAKLGKFIIQPQLMASNYNTKMRLSSPEYDSILSLRQNRFDIPLLLGYAPSKKTRLLAGPVYTKMLENKVHTGDFLFKESKTIFNDGSWAMQLGVGVDIGRLAIDVKYETSLGKLGDSVTINGSSFDFDQRNNTIQFIIGYDFIK